MQANTSIRLHRPHRGRLDVPTPTLAKPELERELLGLVSALAENARLMTARLTNAEHRITELEGKVSHA